MEIPVIVLAGIAVLALVVIGILKKIKTLITCALFVGVIGVIAYFILR